eukprot:2724220-Pyramimonas_sp.AAC.1
MRTTNPANLLTHLSMFIIQKGDQHQSRSRILHVPAAHTSMRLPVGTVVLSMIARLTLAAPLCCR